MVSEVMLRKLVRLVEEEGALQVEDLARRLHTSPALVRAMLDTLERQGRVRPVAPTCGLNAPCSTCPLKGVCGLPSVSTARVWVQKSDGGG